MKNNRTRQAAFTLVELIGVLAVIAILASIIVPSMVRTMDLRSANSEAETLATLVDHVRVEYQRTDALPTAANWSSDLTRYAEMPADAIETNHRLGSRVYIPEPVADPVRALILSSLHHNLALPDDSDITTTTAFDEIWDTLAWQIPPTSSWSGWSAWHNRSDADLYLVIDRVNVQDIIDAAGYGGSGGGISGSGKDGGAVSMQDLRLTMDVQDGKWPSYQLTIDGVTEPVVNLSPGVTSLDGFHSGDVVKLYRWSNGSDLKQTYTFSNQDASFRFTGSSWENDNK